MLHLCKYYHVVKNLAAIKSVSIKSFLCKNFPFPFKICRDLSKTWGGGGGESPILE